MNIIKLIRDDKPTEAEQRRRDLAAKAVRIPFPRTDDATAASEKVAAADDELPVEKLQRGMRSAFAGGSR